MLISALFRPKTEKGFILVYYKKRITGTHNHNYPGTLIYFTSVLGLVVGVYSNISLSYMSFHINSPFVQLAHEE